MLFQSCGECKAQGAGDKDSWEGHPKGETLKCFGRGTWVLFYKKSL